MVERGMGIGLRAAWMALALGAPSFLSAAGPTVKTTPKPKLATGSTAAAAAAGQPIPTMNPAMPRVRFTKIGKQAAGASVATAPEPDVSSFPPRAPLSQADQTRVLQDLQVPAPNPGPSFTLDAGKLVEPGKASLYFFNASYVAPRSGNGKGPIATFESQNGILADIGKNHGVTLTLTVPAGKRWLVDLMVEKGDHYWIRNAYHNQSLPAPEARNLVIVMEEGSHVLTLTGRTESQWESRSWAFRGVRILPLN